MSKMSGTAKLISALSSGQNVSTKVLAKRSGLVNLTSAIHRLRTRAGYDITLVRESNSSGKSVSYYKLAR
jgi:hypothetical protein